MSEETVSSTHKAEVVPVVLEKLEGSDFLSVAKVYGYTCVCRTEDWQGIDRAVYLPPDSVVDATRPEFAFLLPQAAADGKARIKAKKLRGCLSFGLLVPAPAGAGVGQDLAAELGVTHYQPKPKGGGKSGLFLGGEDSGAPPGVYCPTYDLESGRRYAHLAFEPGEPVVITEKLHGCNARYCFKDGVMYCGSRTNWKKEYPNYDHVTMEMLEPKIGREKAEEVLAKLRGRPKAKNLWWRVLDSTSSACGRTARPTPGRSCTARRTGRCRTWPTGAGRTRSGSPPSTS